AATPDGQLLIMPAAGEQGVGVKLVTLTSGNLDRGLPFVQGMYVLFDAATQTPEAVIDGTALTALRTGAVSGLATRWLARPDAAHLLVVGAGVQARVHVEAMRAVRSVDRVTVVSRTPARAANLAAEVGGVVGTPVDLAGADLICLCTSSVEPVLRGALRPGTHVNAVGAYTPEMRELDGAAMASGRLVVEDRATAFAEAGDLLLAIGEGAVTADHVVADLAEVVRGAEVRRDAGDATIFESVGMAFEDLVVARATVDAVA
ncbi:MAG TPA: ornithine cyclodeaminase family protein, partial [Actinomycetota bacterium]|nr:ornithine cyclodeaminase family protein [Actinomycetota bacterium]